MVQSTGIFWKFERRWAVGWALESALNMADLGWQSSKRQNSAYHRLSNYLPKNMELTVLSCVEQLLLMEKKADELFGSGMNTDDQT